MSTGPLQLYGCLTRIAIEKKRSIRTTCCECCSHLIILFILVAGYGLSKIVNFSADTYTHIDVRVPPTDILNLYNNITTGPLVIPTLDQYITVGNLLSSNIKKLGSTGGVISQTSLGRTYTNLLYKGGLHFAPRSPEVHSLIEYLNKTYTTFKTMSVFIHDSEKVGVKYILDNTDHPALALIVLREITPTKVNYVIRQNYTTLPNTNQVILTGTIGLDLGYLDYFFSGFLTLEKAVDQWVFEYTNATRSSANPKAHAACNGPPQVALIPFPTAAYDQNPFYQQVGFLLGLAIVMATMYPMSRLTKSVVEEKELKIREVMKIMGLSEWVHQLSWFLSAFVLFFWIAISCTFITKGSFLTHSSPGLVFIYFFLFCMAEINFAFLVSVFFSNSKLAAIVAPVILFSALMPRYAFLNTNANELVAGKIFSCLLAPTAFAFGADIISNFEYSGVGVQGSNINDGKFNFGTVLLMLWADFYIYGFLAWYLDQVIPHEYGTAHHPLFFLSWNYWCPRSRRSAEAGNVIASSGNALSEHMPEFFDPAGTTETGGAGQATTVQHSTDAHTHPNSVEAIPIEMRHLAKVRVQNLRKRYPDGNLALRDFSLSMLEGQITCLLGHNGAGKTTLISTLTGMIEATSGDALIYGCSLRYDLPAIRQMTGVCPQHNVLYPTLTVLEHLYFFGRIKGMFWTALRNSVDSVIAEVGLTEKRDALSSSLSGGMKRKLSLAIALIGDPKFLLLDEPTSGMDPYSRRSTWELLQKSKVGRVVLLTTHFMEEADTLADRIAIMSEGALRCSGSSYFLKSRFGVGYLLSIAKDRADVDVEPIDELVKSVVPDAKVTSAVAGEVIFQMPLQTVPLFATLFSKLRDQATALGVGSYGISLTTLEQVFISLAKEAKHEHESDHYADPDDHVGDWHYWTALYLRRFLCGIASLCGLDTSVYPSPNHNSQLVAPTAIRQSDPDVEQPRQSSGDAAVSNGNHLTVRANGSPQAMNEQSALESTPPIIGATVDAHKIEEGNTTNNTDVVDRFNGVSQGSIRVQFVELYRKRFIIASRDMKGLFFQVVFPALQILLIMLILTVSVNPAGHSIILNANMFHKNAYVTPVVPVGGAQKSGTGTYRSGLTDLEMDLIYTNMTNSTGMSEYLLDTHDFKDNRYGAYLFKDLIPLNLTVDWSWVKANSGTIMSLLNQTGLGTPQLNLSSLIHLLPAGSIPSFGFNLTNLLDAAALNITTLDKLLKNVFNITLTSLFNLTASQLQHSIGKISIGTVKFNATDNKFTLLNTTITIGKLHITLPSNSVALTPSLLALILPNGLQHYLLELPSAYTIMHNTSSPHGIAAFHGELIATAFQQCSLGGEQSGTETEYLVKNHPLPITTQQAVEIQVILSLLTSIFILVPLCYIPASFVSFLVKERVSKSKHLQIVSSVSPYLYWTATYCWDMSLFGVLIAFILAAFFAFGSAAKVFIHTSESTAALFLLLLTYGASAVPLSYIYSLAFDNYSTAQISIMVINFLTGFVMVLGYYIMVSIPTTHNLGLQLVNFFRFFPPYNIGEGLINLSSAYYYNSVLGLKVGYFDWNVTGRNIVFMAVEAVGYFLAILLTEFSPLLNLGYWLERKRVSFIIPPPLPLHGIDKDVLEEQERVRNVHIEVQPASVGRWWDWMEMSLMGRNSTATATTDVGPAEQHMLVPEAGVEMTGNRLGGHDAPAPPLTAPRCALLIRDLVKTYPPTVPGGQPKHAVRGLSLGCDDGERFGLLGINGAGKTTVLSILTGDLQATSGEVFIGGKPLSDPATMSMIGYCPQVDPLLDLMNGYETLWFFGRIRGIEEDVLRERVNSLILQVGLERFAHKPCGTYSGGNKRKLSLAVALIGDPRVLFLDEPSTGMDPEARRSMWTVIEKVSARRSVVLVTHSMEEVEALCTRMGVMVSGRLQCIGSAQHLKSRFGMGYQVEVRCSPLRIQECILLCQTVMTDAVVEELHGGYVRLKVSRQVDLAAAFSTLEQNKTSFEIYDYSISQCTLEQVFLKFAKDQEEETGQVAGLNAVQSGVSVAGNISAPQRLYQPLSTNAPTEPREDVSAQVLTQPLPTYKAIESEEKG